MGMGLARAGRAACAKVAKTGPWRFKQGAELAVAATTAATVAVFAHLVANQSAGSGATDGAQGGTKYGITEQAPSHRTDASAQLGVVRAVGTATEYQAASEHASYPPCGSNTCLHYFLSFVVIAIHHGHGQTVTALCSAYCKAACALGEDW